MKVLIAIVSCHQFARRRMAQRDSWLPQATAAGVAYRFFVGRCSALPTIVGSQSVVAAPRPDMELLECEDNYEGLSRKVRTAVRWAYQRDYDYLFKCDDDTYVRPERLLTSGFAQHEYSGFIEDYDLRLATNFPVYPHAQGGPGYWLSRKAMAAVVDTMPDKNHQEDFAVGEALALSGIPAVHDDRYVHQEGQALRSDFISLHKCDPEEMRSLHAQLEQVSAH